MLRRLSIFIALLSFMLFLLIVAVWTVFPCSHAYAYRCAGCHGVSVIWDQRCVQVTHVYYGCRSPDEPAFAGAKFVRDPFSLTNTATNDMLLKDYFETLGPLFGRYWGPKGAKLYSFAMGSGGTHGHDVTFPPGVEEFEYRYVIVPAWALLAGLLLVPLIVGASLRRQKIRTRLGLCRVCGYDLRASKSRCPECGTPIGMTAQTTPTTKSIL
jgi:hypothetical protein